MKYIKDHITENDFNLDEILNADETALFYKTVSSRTYKIASEDNKNTKRSKARVTVMVCASAGGTIYDLQVIHTAKQPRCLKNTNISSTYSVQYDVSQRGWQNRRTFKRYVRYLQNIARKQNTRFVLLVDNASSHVCAAKDLDPDGSQDTFFRIDHLDILFLPPNCTSDMQPCDMGIIRSFKCKFRKCQIERLFEVLDNHMQSSSAVPFKIEDVIDMRFCLEMIKSSANHLDENVICRCWAKSNILPAPLQAQLNANVDRLSSIDKDIDDELQLVFQKLDLKRIGVYSSPTSIIDQDAYEPIDETEIDDSLIIETIREEDEKIKCMKEGSINKTKETIPSTAEITAALSTLTKFAQHKEADEGELIRRNIEALRSILLVKAKQSSITYFFNRNN